MIETNTWGVKLDETKIRVTAPVVNTQGKEYEDNIILKIFSKEGYCRVVKIPVKLLTTTIDENSATAWQNFYLIMPRMYCWIIRMLDMTTVKVYR